MTLHSSTPRTDGSGWDVLITNFSSVDSTYSIYVVCVSGLSSYRIESASRVLSPNTALDSFAHCARGELALGGGGSIDTHLSRISATYAPLGGYAHYGSNNDSVPRTLSARAVCTSSVRSVHPYFADGGTEFRPGQIASSTAYCPAGTQVTSGGGYTWGEDVRITDSFPTGNGWRIYAHTRSQTSDGFVRAHITCTVF